MQRRNVYKGRGTGYVPYSKDTKGSNHTSSVEIKDTFVEGVKVNFNMRLESRNEAKHPSIKQDGNTQTLKR